MSIRQGNKIIAGTASNKNADIDLSNLSSIGQKKIDDKVSKTGDTMTGTLNIKQITTHNSDLPMYVYQKNAKKFGAITYSNIGIRDYNTNEEIALFGGVQTPEGQNGFRVLLWDKTVNNWNQVYFITSSNKGANIIDYYGNGDNGYIVYSNGLCQQWGIKNFTYHTETFLLKPYKDGSYNVQVTSMADTYEASTVMPVTRYNNRFYTAQGKGSGNQTDTWAMWNAIGYCW